MKNLSRVAWLCVLALLISLFVATPASAGATVARSSAVKATVAFKVCEHLNGTGRCDTVYKNADGSNFYNLNAINSWMADNATSIINVEAGKTALTMHHENAWGTGWGTVCGTAWVSNASYFIGLGDASGCNDDLGAVRLH